MWHIFSCFHCLLLHFFYLYSDAALKHAEDAAQKGTSVMLDPKLTYTGVPYLFGIDPVSASTFSFSFSLFVFFTLAWTRMWISYRGIKDFPFLHFHLYLKLYALTNHGFRPISLWLLSWLCYKEKCISYIVIIGKHAYSRPIQAMKSHVVHTVWCYNTIWGTCVFLQIADLAGVQEQADLYQLIQNEAVDCVWSGAHDVRCLSEFLQPQVGPSISPTLNLFCLLYVLHSLFPRYSFVELHKDVKGRN